MNPMDGKICVVTGSTQGLGAAIARRLAEAGAAVNFDQSVWGDGL